MAPKTDIENERNRVWYGNPTRHLTCTNCCADVTYLSRAVFNEGHAAGMRYGIRTTTQFSPHVAKMVELLTWLYSGEADEYQNSYTEMYLACRDVYATYGANTAAMERLGRALASINSGLVKDSTNA